MIQKSIPGLTSQLKDKLIQQALERRLQQINTTSIDSKPASILTEKYIIPEQYYQFMRDVKDATKYRVTNIPPKVSEHKALITSWMTYWPISALWTLINDPIVRLFDSIYYGIAEYLQAISNKKFAGIIKDPNGSP